MFRFDQQIVLFCLNIWNLGLTKVEKSFRNKLISEDKYHGNNLADFKH